MRKFNIGDHVRVTHIITVVNQTQPDPAMLHFAGMIGRVVSINGNPENTRFPYRVFFAATKEYENFKTEELESEAWWDA